MKAKIIPIIALLSLFLVFTTSCEDTTYKEYKGYAPVYMSYASLRSAVKTEQNVDLVNPGKIYFKDNYIFIIEELKGIHVYDNTNPAAPVKKSFINLPGVIDMAISGSSLYADSYVDLVVLDVEDINNIYEAGRVQNILPYTIPRAGTDFPNGPINKDKGVVLEWKLGTVREKVNYTGNNYPYFKLSSATMEGDFTSNSSGISGSGVGIGGSMARFGIKDKYLYIVDNNNLKVFNITNKTAPVQSYQFNPGWNVETMFLTGNKMFLGTTTGMAVYDITNPSFPVSQSFFRHARSCDPVIVDDTLAYVTLRSGTTCGGTLNCLDVVNIKNISTPVLVKSYPFTNPHGLGKDGDILFVCDGAAGLKVYDASDPKDIANHLVFSYPNIKSYDVIPVGNVLVMIGDDGLFQYSYSNVQNITLLSSILPVKE